MRIILTFCLLFGAFLDGIAQERVQFSTSKSSVKLHFKLVNNLIILPINVNGVPLNFLVDTGVEETILFSLDEKKEIPLYNVEKIMLKGLGSQEAVEGLKSFKNTLSVKGVEFLNQEIIIVLDENLNFSSSLGIEVNGIIGYHFFNETIVKIDYDRRIMRLYNPELYDKSKVTRKHTAFDFTLENAKPYLKLNVTMGTRNIAAKCLIDSGNSDGLWLFANHEKGIEIPLKHFDDYLGRGFSGGIYGKKAKVEKMTLGTYGFNDVITAFPDSISLVNVRMVPNRLGSIGGEILRRFNVIFDYQNKQLFLKVNKFYHEKFRYNSAGISIHHTGVQWYKEELPVKQFEVNQESHYEKEKGAALQYNFKLLPIYEILNVRENSAAEKAGLQVGDVVIKINGNRVYRMTLDKMNDLLKVDHGQDIKIVISRKGQELTYEFKIVALL